MTIGMVLAAIAFAVTGFIQIKIQVCTSSRPLKCQEIEKKTGEEKTS